MNLCNNCGMIALRDEGHGDSEDCIRDLKEMLVKIREVDDNEIKVLQQRVADLEKVNAVHWKARESLQSELTKLCADYTAAVGGQLK